MPSEGSETSELIVVDLDAGGIAGRLTLPRRVRCLAVDDHHIFYAPTVGTFLYRIDLDRVEQTARAFLEVPAQALAIVPGGRLALFGERGEVRFYDTESLRPVAETSENEGLRPLHPAIRAEIPTAFPGGLVRFAGRIHDRENGRVFCLVGPLGFPMMVPRDSPGGIERVLWGRRVDGQSLSDWRGNPIARWQSEAVAVSTEHPLAILFRVERIGPNPQFRDVLEYRDLVLGNLLATRVLEEVPITPGAMGHRPDFRALLEVTRGGRVVLVKDDRLYPSRVPESILDEMPIPLHLRIPEAPLTIDASGEAAILLEASGGTGRTSLQLHKDIEGVMLDPASGVLTVSGPEVWEAHRSQDDWAWSIWDRIDQLMPAYRVRFRQLTDEPLGDDRLPVELPLSVIAQDEEGQQDRLELSLILLAPLEELPQEEIPYDSPIEVEDEEDGDSEIAAKLRDLDSRLLNMESKFDAILKQLERLDPGDDEGGEQPPQEPGNLP
jgi:hypothetical protein